MRLGRLQLALLVTTTLCWAALGHAQSNMVSIAGSTVNMRASPGKQGEVIWRLDRHYPLKVLQRRNGWLKVRDFEGDMGWVAARLTSRSPSMIVKSSRANIRSGPGTRYRIVARAEYGELLKTREKRGRWVNVFFPGKGKSGWVARSLVWGW